MGNAVELPVIVRDPQRESKLTSYPCACVSNYNQLISKDRLDNLDKVVVKYKDTEKKQVLVDKVAKPYYLYYQVDFYAKFQTDIDEMTRMWLGNIDSHYVLEVRDTNNNKRYCNMVEQPYKHNRTDGNIYQRSYTYKVWVELDESIPVEVPTVQQVIIRR